MYTGNSRGPSGDRHREICLKKTGYKSTDSNRPPVSESFQRRYRSVFEIGEKNMNVSLKILNKSFAISVTNKNSHSLFLLRANIAFY